MSVWAELIDLVSETGGIHLATKNRIEDFGPGELVQYYEPGRITHDLNHRTIMDVICVSVGEKFIKLDPWHGLGQGTHPTQPR